jgi:hypothetical protein
MTNEEHEHRALALAQYVELVTRLRIFHRGTVPTAEEAAHDLDELEALLETSGTHFTDPELNLIALKAQVAGQLHEQPPAVH